MALFLTAARFPQPFINFVALSGIKNVPRLFLSLIAIPKFWDPLLKNMSIQHTCMNISFRKPDERSKISAEGDRDEIENRL